jgi:hypothetical protein
MQSQTYDSNGRPIVPLTLEELKEIDSITHMFLAFLNSGGARRGTPPTLLNPLILQVRQLRQRLAQLLTSLPEYTEGRCFPFTPQEAKMLDSAMLAFLVFMRYLVPPSLERDEAIVRAEGLCLRLFGQVPHLDHDALHQLDALN